MEAIEIDEAGSTPHKETAPFRKKLNVNDF